MIELVGSKVVARKPTDINLETASEDDADGEEAIVTPRALTEDVDIDPYRTPVALAPANRKNKARVMEDIVVEPSDIEVKFEEVKSSYEVLKMEDLQERKKQRVLTSAADKVHLLWLIDWSYIFLIEIYFS